VLEICDELLLKEELGEEDSDVGSDDCAGDAFEVLILGVAIGVADDGGGLVEVSATPLWEA
jgi:hypothetical protein